MFSPCAPIGGSTCAASAIRAVRSPAIRAAIWLMIGHCVRRLASVSGPRIWQERALIAASNSSTGRADSRAISGPLSIQTTAEAGLPAAIRQRDQSEWPARAVDFGRDIVMRDRVGHRKGQRLLPVAIGFHRNSQRFAHGRIAAIGGNHQPGVDLVAV